MISEMMSAITGVKTTTDILKVALDVKTFNDVSGALGDVLAKLVAAHSAALLIQEKNAALHAEVVQLREDLAAAQKENDRLLAWNDERSNYALQEVAPGAFAYVRKPDHEAPEQPGEAKHWLCCRCYHEGRKSILQFARHEGGCRVHVCHCCQASISVREPSAGATVVSVPRGRRMF